jgi:hypothetical protein
MRSFREEQKNGKTAVNSDLRAPSDGDGKAGHLRWYVPG